MIKQGCIRVTRRLGIYNYLRHNALFHVVEHRLKKEAKDSFDKRVRNLRDFVGPGPFLAFDVGANIGQFSGPLLNLGAEVVAVEPDNDAAQILRIAFWGRRLRLERCALSDSPGYADFFRQHPSSQRNSLIQEEIGAAVESKIRVRVSTLENLISIYGIPHFLKIDVEGNEPAVLRGLGRPISHVMFESNTPQAADQGVACVNRLTELDSNYQFAIAPAGWVLPTNWGSKAAVIHNIKSSTQPIDIFARQPKP